MSDEKTSKSLSGIVVITIGALLLLRNLGLLNFSIWESLRTYWPVIIILLGISLIIKAKGFVSLLIIGTILILGASFFDSTDIGATRSSAQTIELDNIEEVNLNLEYGAGDLAISSGNTGKLLRNDFKTTDQEDPKIEFSKSQDSATISLVKFDQEFSFWRNPVSEWDIKLSKLPRYNIELNYGATNADIDLSELKVDSLDIESGATNTRIRFSNYPISVDLSTGASSIELEFPKDSGVKMMIDGGVISVNFADFEKNGNTYTSANYDPKGDNNLILDIEAGASSITSRFY